MPNKFTGLSPEDDLLAMERSCLHTFLDPGQKSLLLYLWEVRERGDNEAFLAKHTTIYADLNKV